MAEFTPTQNALDKDGHFPKTETAMVELHRLVSIFLSSREFARLRTNYPGEGFDPIFELQDVEEDEITRILLMLAITARVIDDREGYVYDLAGGRCGDLQEDVSKPELVDLELREACNKIIHAKKVRFDVEEERNEQSYFRPFVYLYGSKGKVDWKATLDVIAFAKWYVICVRNF